MFGQRYLISLDRCHQLVAIVFVGVNAQLGYTTPADLRDDYPAFFWNVVHRYIQDGVHYLRATQDGKQWIANLYAQVFTVERHDRLTSESTAT